MRLRRRRFARTATIDVRDVVLLRQILSDLETSSALPTKLILLGFLFVLQSGHLFLVVIVICTIHLDVVEFERVDSLAGGNDSEPLSQLVLLQELLRQILEVSARELSVRDNDDFSCTFTRNLNGFSKVTGPSVNLDSVVEELFECRTEGDQLQFSRDRKARVTYTSKILSSAGTVASMVNLWVT